jgi:hypothetical protein
VQVGDLRDKYALPSAADAVRYDPREALPVVIPKPLSLEQVRPTSPYYRDCSLLIDSANACFTS